MRETRLRHIIYKLEEQNHVVRYWPSIILSYPPPTFLGSDLLLRENIRAQAVEIKQQLDHDSLLGHGPSNTKPISAISAQEMQAVSSSLAAPWDSDTTLGVGRNKPTHHYRPEKAPPNVGSAGASSGPTSPTYPNLTRRDPENPYTALFNYALKKLDSFNRKTASEINWYLAELDKLTVAPDPSSASKPEGSVTVQSPRIGQAQTPTSTVSMGPPIGFPSKHPS
ncbi:MAG: hypothetical protein M1829_004080 [Trizodia sp. TS-e1964]|nr:MAG: hypothetical protein M1829_004080 [Trizodia sp. TS-e1964]